MLCLLNKHDSYVMSKVLGPRVKPQAGASCSAQELKEIPETLPALTDHWKIGHSVLLVTFSVLGWAHGKEHGQMLRVFPKTHTCTQEWQE